RRPSRSLQKHGRLCKRQGAHLLRKWSAGAQSSGCVTRGMALDARTVFTFGLDAPRSERDWGLIESDGEAWLAQGDEKLMAASHLRVTGLHNAANALAALALARAVDLPYQPLLRALAEFEGLPHRVQKV